MNIYHTLRKGKAIFCNLKAKKIYLRQQNLFQLNFSLVNKDN
jgi:hypothetical protein